MQQAWSLNDEVQWEKTRVIAFYAANSQFFKHPTKKIESIIFLPSIDKDEQTNFDELREKLLAKREALRNKA